VAGAGEETAAWQQLTEAMSVAASDHAVAVTCSVIPLDMTM
jgi:hypothetical protein